MSEADRLWDKLDITFSRWGLTEIPFSEIMPILEKLVQLDLLRRLPTERAAEFGPSPMLLGKREKSEGAS